MLNAKLAVSYLVFFLVIYILYIFCWVGGGSTIPIVAHPSPQKACPYNVQYLSFFLYCPHLEGTIRNSKKSVNQNTVINTFITENRLQICYILSFLFCRTTQQKNSGDIFFNVFGIWRCSLWLCHHKFKSWNTDLRWWRPTHYLLSQQPWSDCLPWSVSSQCFFGVTLNALNSLH